MVKTINATRHYDHLAEYLAEAGGRFKLTWVRRTVSAAYLLTGLGTLLECRAHVVPLKGNPANGEHAAVYVEYPDSNGPRRALFGERIGDGED